MGVGTIVTSTLIKIVCEKLGSPLIKEFSLLWGVEKDLNAFESTILTVKDVLEDAEKCCITDKQDYNWLRKLKENVYDADDLLDKLYLNAQRQKDDSRGQINRVINNCLSKSNPVKRLKLAHKIRSINKKLNVIAAERAKFHLKNKIVKYKEIDINYRETWSMTDEGAICGRDHEKEEVMGWLMQNDGHENISVISIVGLGGLGKTTLAQLVYNSENELNGYFDLRMWVYVSQKFDVRRIVRELVESATQNKCEIENLNSLGEKLRSELNGKRFLLVLDDVWSEDFGEWEKLNSILKFGAFGSKIIVTTRSMRVSQITKATFCINLEGLSEDMSWDLFRKRAFGGSETGFDSQILGIAKEIMKKCGGVPLALKALGSIMQFKVSIEEWLAVRDSDIWALTCDGDEVIRSLKLSYMHLPAPLKECFTYCSIFPKGQVINKLELIDQWIAHGLVSLPDNMGSIENKANEYFKHLVQMSFFQNVEYSKGELTCMMHDLVHDLARSIIGPEFSEMKGDGVTSNNGSSYRYLSLLRCSEKVKPTVGKKLRALHIQGGNFDVSDMVAIAKNLHSLVLQWLKFDTLPICSKLIHLRYICIVGCEFTLIPDDIGILWSLQALHLKGCNRITNLPESIGKLVCLRTLVLHCDQLKSLPGSIGQCQSLQNLIVGFNHIESIPNSLGQLANIRLLKFSRCAELKILPDDAFGMINFIRSLSFSDCWNLKEVPVSIGNLVNLESLDLSLCTKLKSLPESIGNLVNLVTLNVDKTGLVELPICLGEMKKLRYLYLDGCRLCGMPIGIGKLIDLRRMSTFYQGKEGKYAQTSELEHLNFLSGSLAISSLDYLSNPNEAVQAKLKDKQYVEHLKLSWHLWAAFLDKPPKSDWLAVLEALQPPSSIKTLILWGYPGAEYPKWMMLGEISMPTFPYLTSLTLHHLKWCSSLPSLAELSHLRFLRLWGIDHLTIVSGYFPSLVELRLMYMPNLEEMMTMNLANSEESGTNNIYEPAFPCLSKLVIRNCPKLRMRPHLPPSVGELELCQSNEELLTGVGLSVGEASSKVSASSLSVREFTIRGMKLSAECILLGQLSSLTELKFYECELDCLPESMRHLSSLRLLEIGLCYRLHELPEWLGEFKSLKRLHIYNTPLKFLPASIQNLRSLHVLGIMGCPELEKRC